MSAVRERREARILMEIEAQRQAAAEFLEKESSTESSFYVFMSKFAEI